MNWKEFHKELDLRMAIYISERRRYPSQTSMMEFMEFSHKKSKEEDDGKEKDNYTCY